MSEPTEQSSVETSRDLDAPPSTVWDAIVDPDRLGQWLGGDVDVEISEGSEGTIDFGKDDEPAVVLIETVDENERLVFRWATTVAAPTEVTIGLEPTRHGTRITVVERAIPNGESSPSIAEASAGLRPLVRRRSVACVA